MTNFKQPLNMYSSPMSWGNTGGILSRKVTSPSSTTYTGGRQFGQDISLAENSFKVPTSVEPNVQTNINTSQNTSSNKPGSGYSLATQGILSGAALVAKNAQNEASLAPAKRGTYGTAKPDVDAAGKAIITGTASNAASIAGTAGSVVGTAIGGPVVGGVVGLIASALGYGVGMMLGNTKAAKQKKELTDAYYNEENRKRLAQQREDAKLSYSSMSRPMFARSGQLVPMMSEGSNLIPNGKMHKENNNLGLRDKGVPVISREGVKVMEIEKGEWILNRDKAAQLTSLANEYNQTKDSDILVTMGKIGVKELLHNTKDLTKTFKKIN